MNKKISKSERIKGYLTLLFVVVFAAFLFFRFVPLGNSAQNIEVSKTGICSEQTIIPLTLELKSGAVDIELWCDVAPNHVNRIASLANSGFYDGIVFHRVIDGFMAQTGDPTGTGMGGSDLPDIKAEFSDEPFVRGTLGMARSNSPNSANSQFFITFGDAAFLNNNYTVFGKVISGMENVDAIKKGDSDNNGVVIEPDKIISLKVGKTD